MRQGKSKFYVALIGVALIGLSVFFDINLKIGPEGVYEFIVSTLTALGLYQIRN